MADLRVDEDELTADERKAIGSLQRLARNWPSSLSLVSAAGSLIVLRTDRDRDIDSRLSPDDVLADVPGIPNDGGDPW